MKKQDRGKFWTVNWDCPSKSGTVGGYALCWCKVCAQHHHTCYIVVVYIVVASHFTQTSLQSHREFCTIIVLHSFKWHNLKAKQLTSSLIYTEPISIFICVCQISPAHTLTGQILYAYSEKYHIAGNFRMVLIFTYFACAFCMRKLKPRKFEPSNFCMNFDLATRSEDRMRSARIVPNP